MIFHKIRQLFCVHDYRPIGVTYHDSYVTRQYCCKKCGKKVGMVWKK